MNVYSFNKLLMDGEIDLSDVLDFCAKYNFDATDPTGYHFPGYPDVPGDKYINEFKRKAYLLGLDISGTGLRNDFAKLFGIIKDAGCRGYLPIETLGAGDPFEKVPVLLSKVKNAMK